MLVIQNMDVSYGEKRVLNDISFEVQEKELVCIIGSNGAGKTTIIKTLCGFIFPSRGAINFGKMSIRDKAPHKRCLLGIGVVPEGRRVFPYLSVEKNLLIGAYLRKDKAGILESKEYVFDLFPILKERIHQSGGTLSGGEQQMLAIARALMTKPRLLLMDEPSIGLAPIFVKQIFKSIQELNRQGISILLVEQNAKKALEISDRGYVLDLGRIILSEGAGDLLNNQQVKAAYLGNLDMERFK